VFASPHASAAAQLPAAVAQPPTASHDAVQHTFDGPAAHVVDVAVHAHVSHAPSPLQVLVHEAG
jgi:hypothetical protein